MTAQLRRLAKENLPSGVVAALRRWHRRLVPVRWSVAYRLAGLLRFVEKGRMRRLLIAVIHLAWGNQSYSASRRLCTELDELAAEANFAVEMGSGLTTVLLTRGRPNLRLVTLEHDAEWGGAMRGAMGTAPRHELRIVDLVQHEPGIEWYDVTLDDLRAADLIVCDGPPGDTPGGRRGVLRLLAERVGRQVLLVDDVQRADEQQLTEEIVERCGGGARRTVVDGTKRFAIITLPAPPDPR